MLNILHDVKAAILFEEEGSKKQTVIQYIYGKKKWIFLEEERIIYSFKSDIKKEGDGWIMEEGKCISEMPPVSPFCFKQKFIGASCKKEPCIMISHPDLGTISINTSPLLSRESSLERIQHESQLQESQSQLQRQLQRQLQGQEQGQSQHQRLHQ